MKNNQAVSKRGGARPGAGRKKGVPNKLTSDVKAMILTALNEVGGSEYLVRQSEDNPVAFMTLVGKVLPLTVAGDQDNPLKTVSEIILRGVKADAG